MVQRSEPVYHEIDDIFVEFERNQRLRADPFLVFACTNSNELSQSSSNHSAHSTQDSTWSRPQTQTQGRNEDFVARFGLGTAAATDCRCHREEEEPKEEALPASITLPGAKGARKRRSDSQTPQKCARKRSQRKPRQSSLTPAKSGGYEPERRRGKAKAVKRSLNEIEAEMPSGKRTKPDLEPEGETEKGKRQSGGNRTLEQFGIFACKLN